MQVSATRKVGKLDFAPPVGMTSRIEEPMAIW
jgi:hypothetical protein